MILIIVFVAIIIILTILITISMHYVVTSKKPEDNKVRYVQDVCEILELCKIESGERNILKKIDEILFSIRCEDVNSPDAARDVETRIKIKASELLDNLRNRKNVEVNSNIDELIKLVKERNVVSSNNK